MPRPDILLAPRSLAAFRNLVQRELGGQHAAVHGVHPLLHLQPDDRGKTPLAQLPNAVLTPHIGSATIESRTAMAAQAAQNLKEGLEGKVPPNLVNPDAISKSRS